MRSLLTEWVLKTEPITKITKKLLLACPEQLLVTDLLTFTKVG